MKTKRKLIQHELGLGIMPQINGRSGTNLEFRIGNRNGFLIFEWHVFSLMVNLMAVNHEIEYHVLRFITQCFFNIYLFDSTNILALKEELMYTISNCFFFSSTKCVYSRLFVRIEFIEFIEKVSLN